MMTDSNDATAHGKVSRRRFGKRTLTFAAAAGFSRRLRAQTDTEISSPQNDAELSPAENQEIDARMANLVRVYGDRLSDDQRKLLRRVLTENEHMLAHIRGFALSNGDPPANVLELLPRPVSREEARRLNWNAD